MAIEITNDELSEILENTAEEIEEEDKELLKYIALAIGFDIAVFANRINKQIALYRTTGIGDAEISRLLATDLQSNVRIFGY